MKTRHLRVWFSARVEHRTDGWYYRDPDTKHFEGPYRNVQELAEEFADILEEQMRWLYRMLHKEAPR